MNGFDHEAVGPRRKPEAARSTLRERRSRSESTIRLATNRVELSARTVRQDSGGDELVSGSWENRLRSGSGERSSRRWLLVKTVRSSRDVLDVAGVRAIETLDRIIYGGVVGSEYAYN
ncbi:hypothetical protein BB347_05360 [Natronorubrum daqingense]|uniref:Uncharacterized protein n=1 Tax=Natronorubrum daqingense TaxID=588898 RepID=A0A1P8RC32_9EURY|nr:hypothetical protein BB347_05360 [Natronorubrum daqingense]